jgi:hypothetical protein
MRLLPEVSLDRRMYLRNTFVFCFPNMTAVRDAILAGLKKDSGHLPSFASDNNHGNEITTLAWKLD